MKKFILILLLLTTVYAQNRSKKKATQPSVSKTVVNKIKQTNTESVPRRISYQGLITKADGSPTDDGSYEVTFRVYSTVDGGSPIWTENQEVTVNNGIISTVLGNTNPFTVIPQEAYLELTVDGSTLSPRQILTSVFYSVLSDTSAYARTADYDDLIDLPDLDVYVLKDSLDSYTTSSDLFDTLSTYQQIDSNLTDLVEDGILSSSKVEFGITSDGVTGQSWISDGDGSGEWGIPTAIAADDIIIGDTAIVLETTNGGINITPGDNAVVVIDSTVTIDGGTVGIVEDSDLITLSPDTLTVRGGIVAATLSGAAVLDEDDMVSDSDTRLATQQSIKAYIDTKQDADENLETIASLEQTDGAFIVSDGTEWTVESDSIARASLGLGSIATQNINNINIDGGVIDGTTIGAASPAEGNFTNLNASTRAEFGTMTIQSGSILDGNGSISFGTNNLATTGTISAGTGFTPDEADGAHIGTSSSEFSDIFLADGSVINLGDDQDVTLTHVPDDGLKLNGSSQFQFGDSGTQISQSADGVLDLVSDNVVEINGATIDINGDTEITGNTTLDNATIDYVKIDGPYIGHIDDTDLVTLSNGLATVDGEVSLTTLDIGGTDVTSTAEELNILDGVTATATELNYNDVTTLGTSEPSKAVTVDANGDLIVPDSDKYMFGTGSDMELYHDGSNSFIANKTGDLNVGTETNGIAVNIGHSTSEVTVGDNFTVAGDAAVTGDATITGSITANSFSGDGSSITGVQATSIGTLSGTSPIIIEGNSPDDFETTLAVEEPTSDRTITFPNNTGTIITTANDSDIDQVGTITSGVWNGTAIADAYVPDDITLSGATIDNSVIGGTTPAAATATTITANTGIIPDESDGAYLGTSSAQFSDVFLADGAVINLGDEQDVTLTHVEDTGVKLNSSNQLQFGDSGTQISQSADGVLDLVSDNEVEINGTTIDINGAVDISGAIANASTITTAGSVLPASVDGAALGSSSAEFSDVFLADGAVMNLGNNQDVTLTHIKDTGVKLNSSNQLQFGDSGTQISQSADGVLDLVSDNEVEINGTTIDINGAVDISGAIANASTITTAGSVLPASVDGAALGSSSAEFSDVFLADGAVMNLGNNQDVTLTHIEDEGIRLNSLNQLQFGDSGTKISQSADGVLDLVSDNEVEINGTTIDINGNTELENATIDYVKIDGTYIGHADDTDLMTLANGTLTVSGTLAATTLTGDGSNLTGISASSILADDISQGNAAVTIGTSLGAVNINPASGSPILLDNTINIDGSLIGHTDDTDLITLENGSVTFTGSTVIPTADVNGGAIDAVTLGTNSAVTQAVIDNVNIDGAVIGHTSDTDLMTLADGSVTFTGSTVIPTADVNGGAIDAVTLGTNSAVTQAVIDNVNIDGAVIGHTSDTDLMTLADGSVTFTGSTVIPTADVNGGAIDAVTLGTNSSVTQAVIDDINLNGATIGHTSDTDLMTLADGSVTFTGSTVIPTADVNGGAIDAVTLGTNSPVTQAVIDNVNINGAQIGHTTDTDLMTLSSDVVTVAGTVAATAVTGDGSGLTGITASVMKSDDISQGDAAVTISTSSGAVNINPASGSPVLLDNTINIDGAVIGHTDDTDLMTLANGSVTFTGSTVIGTADVNGGAIDAVTLGTNSAVTQAVIDNVNINGAEIGHTSDTDLITLADGSVTFTGSTVIGTADVNGGAIDAVTLGTNSAVTQAVIDNVNINGSNIGHTDDTDLLTLADGIATVAGEISVTTLDIGGTDVTSTAAELNKLDDVTATTAELNYTDVTTLGTSEASKAVTVDANGDLLIPDSDKYKFGAGSDMQLYHDGSNSYITNATGAMKVATETSGIAVTVGHSTSETTIGDNLTVGGDVAVAGDVTITGNDITFGNGETISNSTDGDFLFTTGTQTGALTVKNSNTTDGVASLELVSDNSGDVGDGYELKSVNGTFTVTSDHSTKGTYEDTYLTIVGNSTPASSSTTIAGDLTISGDDLTMGTNTSGAALIGDGTNYNPVVISGDLSIGANGTASIGSGVIVNADINATASIADSKLATITTADKVSGAALQVDGATSGTGITIADDDKFLVDDGGTTKYINASQVLTYTSSTITTSSADINGGAIDAVTLGTNSAVTRAVIDNINIDGAVIGHTSDTDLMTLADGSVTFTGSTVIGTADVNGGAIDAVTLGTNSAVTQAVIDNVNINGAQIGHTDDNDLMTLADGSVTFTGSTVIGTADVNSGAIDGVTLGTNSAVTRAVIDNIEMNNNTIGHTSDTDLLTLASGIATVAGELSATTLDIGGTNISASAAELNYTDVTTLGTSQASKAVTVDSNGDLLVPDSDKYKFGAGSDMQLYHDGSNSYITNATGAMKVATESSGIAVTIGHSTSETTVGDNLTVTGDAAVTGALTLGTTLAVAEGGTGTTSLTDKAVLISQDSGTDAIGSVAMSGNGEILVGGTSGPAVEAAADVAGTGLDASTGDGTLAINVAAAQTSITSIINSGITKIGTAADQEYITFGSANEVNTYVNNTEALSVTASGIDVTGNATISGDFTISSASKGINTTSGSNVAHDEASNTTLTANNNRRGKYTFTTNATVADDAHSAKFTVANNTATSDDIIVMNCTSNHQVEVHTFNVSSSGWDFIVVNRSGGVLAADTDLVFNFIVMQ